MAPTVDKHFLPEIWALFTLGTLWVVMRFIVRIRTFGICGLRLDDAFAAVAVVCWAVIIAGINCTYYTSTNIDWKPEEVWALSPHKVKEVEWGSKFYIITLYAYIVMVFSLKAIVIILYRRLAFGAWQNTLLNFTVFLCICGFIATTLMLSLMCLPFSRRFKVQPLPDNNCTASSHFFIALSCFNAVTDAFLLAIPVPLLWTLRIPLRKRIMVFVLLSSGIFVMAACITRVALTVVPNITVRIIARWGARELSIALIAVNSSSLRPMFGKSFWVNKPAVLPQHQPRRNRDDAEKVSTVHRLGRALVRGHFRNADLHSTSPDQSTMERFAQSQATTAYGDCEVPAPPRAYRPPNWRWPRPLITLTSFGSQALQSLARGRMTSHAASIQGVRSVQENMTNTDNRWKADIEAGKRVNQLARIATADSVLTDPHMFTATAVDSHPRPSNNDDTINRDADDAPRATRTEAEIKEVETKQVENL